jgi:hypothetical protein
MPQTQVFGWLVVMVEGGDDGTGWWMTAFSQ